MRRNVVVGVALGIVGLGVLESSLARAGLVADVLPRAAGPAPWIASRALGITSYFALTLEVLLGLLVSSGAADGLLARARTAELHRFLSVLALGLVGAHAMMLLGDGLVRFDALDLLVPFAARVRRIAVGVGVLAAYLLLVLHVSSALRARIGARAWRRLHYASFALYLGATAHGIAAGTDSARPWMMASYVLSLVAVALLVARRLALRPPARRDHAVQAASGRSRSAII